MKKIFFALLLFVALGFSQTISKIEVVGNRYIQSSLIKGFMKLHPGMQFSQTMLAEDIKRLYETGYFKNIAVKEVKKDDHVKLIYIVEDLPIIYRIEFKGNKRLSSKDLAKKLGIETEVGKFGLNQATRGLTPASSINEKVEIIKQFQLGKVLSEEDIHQLMERIKKAYEEAGYSHVGISYKIIPVKGASRLVFYIKETKPTYVMDIHFKGNKTFSDGRLLDHMKTQPFSLLAFRWHPPFNKHILMDDIKRLKKFYEDEGFFEVQIDKPIIKKHGHWVNITITINEGPRYKIGNIVFKGNKMYSKDELLDKIIEHRDSKRYYKKSIIKLIKKRIFDKYGQIGFINEYTSVKKEPNFKNKTVNLVFHVYEGGPVYAGKIHIRGNYETRDYVIRREMRVQEYDLITRHELSRSKDRIMNLGYYDNVQIVPVPRPDNFDDIYTKIQERYTGQFSVGLGYNQVTGLAGFASIRKGNFLGTGDIAGISLSYGANYENDSISYTHKWLFNKPIDVTGSLYDTKIYYIDYTVQRVGFDLSFTREFGEYWYASAGTSIQKVTYSDISSSTPPVIQSQAGTWQARKLIFSLSHNTTNYYLFPSKGSIQSITYTIALPVLGGTEKYQKLVLSNANFIKDHIFYTGTIFSARETIGWAQAYSNSVVPLDDEFFVGGDYTIRGYSYGYAGPLDSADEPIGATREIVLNFEADYPLYKNIFYVDAFYDTGRGADSWSGLKPSNWLGSYGVGIRFITAYAPVRLDLAFKTKPVPGDTAREKISFVLGSFF